MTIDTAAAFTDDELAVVRRAYARQIVALAGIDEDRPLERAFAKIERERFLGKPPWKLAMPTGRYKTMTTRDSVILYQDALFALDARRHVNNGSPSLHAQWIHALGPKPGETIVHLGAGSGYYTAILAELVGPGGSVIAVEFDRDLSRLAEENLRPFGNSRVLNGNGTILPDEPVDGIYVNFGVERPMSAWIDNLNPGGRLVFPLGHREAHRIAGGGFRIERRGEAFATEYLGPAWFIPAEGSIAATADQRTRLKAAFACSTASNVKSFLWRCDVPPAGCWFAAEDWAFSYDEVS